MDGIRWHRWNAGVGVVWLRMGRCQVWFQETGAVGSARGGLRDHPLCMGHLLASAVACGSSGDDSSLDLSKGLRIAGSFMYHLQRLCGGTPEAVDAEYVGPGLGQTPETSDLRRFKYSANTEKWVVIKRDSRVAVFKLSSESCTIRSSGFFAGIEPDTLRGSASLLKDLKGYDKVHLCRATTCAEEGQHFQIYGLAKKFDPVRFQDESVKSRRQRSWRYAVDMGDKEVQRRLQNVSATLDPNLKRRMLRALGTV